VLITAARVLVVAAAFLAIGFLACPRTPATDPSEIVKSTLLGRPGPFHILYESSSGGTDEQFSVLCSTGTFLKCLESSLPDESPHRAEVLRALSEAATGDRYRLLLEGKDRIAGRLCSTVRMKPPSKKDEWFQVWIDADNGLLLAWRHWTHDGVLISRTSATDVRLPD